MAEMVTLYMAHFNKILLCTKEQFSEADSTVHYAYYDPRKSKMVHELS